MGRTKLKRHLLGGGTRTTWEKSRNELMSLAGREIREGIFGAERRVAREDGPHGPPDLHVQKNLGGSTSIEISKRLFHEDVQQIFLR